VITFIGLQCLTFSVIKNPKNKSCNENIVKIIKKNIKAIFFQFSNIKLEQEASNIVTVCHGDAWSNNMMFEESEDSATLIDFQMISLAHPARDLWYLLSVNTDRVIIICSQKFILVSIQN
jgi:thiamine kinase-like enzyme